MAKIDLNVKPKFVKLLDKNIKKKTFMILGYSIFLDMTAKVKSIKLKKMIIGLDQNLKLLLFERHFPKNEETIGREDICKAYI